MKYFALTPELLAMTEELEELGGGDARVGRAAVCCVLRTAHAAGAERSIVQTGVGALTVQDPRASSLSRVSKSFPLPSCQGKQAVATVGVVLGQESVDWVIDGFSATLLAFGQSAAGKSTTLFGDQSSAEEPLFFSLLQEIFTQTARHGQKTHRIGFSCWEVLQHEVFDLLTDPCQSNVPGQEFSASTASEACLCVEISSVQEATSLLRLAQTNSSNWISNKYGQMEPVPNRAHFFVRIVLYDTVKQWMSTLHVIDLAGSQSLHPQAPGQQYKERLAINQDLLGLGKFISELSCLSTSQSSAARQLTSGRDSALMQLVGPLLAGNARAFFLAAVSQHPDHYLDTVNTLRIATRTQKIQTACMRTTAVRPEQVSMAAAAQVLADAKSWSAPGANSRMKMEPQSANLRIQKEKPEMVRPAQSRQHSDSLHSSRPVSAKQVRQRASSKQQQQLSLSHTAAAMDAQSPSGMPVPGAQQQSINPASRYPLAELMSAYPAEQGRQLRGAGLYEEALGDDMCGPIELTWEGVLQAASASDQPPHQPGALSSEPSFAFHRKPHLASASHNSDQHSRLSPASTLQQHAPPDSAAHTQCNAAHTDRSFGTEAGLHHNMPTGLPANQQPHAAGQGAASLRSEAVSSKQQASLVLPQPTALQGIHGYRQQYLAPHGTALELLDNGDIPESSQQPRLPHAASASQARQEGGALNCQDAGWLKASESQARQQGEASDCQEAGWSQASAHTPQELADHLDKLKQEFRQIYSTLSDGDARQSQQQESALPALPRQHGGPAAPESLPITSKPCSGPEPQSRQGSHASSPTPWNSSLPDHPCTDPCRAAEWPQLDTSSPVSHGQPRPYQPNCDLQQLVQQQQQQPGEPQSRHQGSSDHAAQVIASQEQTVSHNDLERVCQNDRAVGNGNGLSQLVACNDRSEPPGNVAHLQAMDHGSGLDLGSDDGNTVTGDSSRVFLEGLRPRSPSQRCSPETAAHVQSMHTGRGSKSSSEEQAVVDLRINNEALLCMLERERQHSQQLAQALHQAQADALERSLEQQVGLEEGRLAAVALRSKCRKLESESLFADVFEKYEKEIRQLQEEVQQLKQCNIALGQQLALREVAGPPLPHPRSPLKQVPVPSQAAALKGTSVPAEPSRAKLHGQDCKLQAEDRVPAEDWLQNKLSQDEGSQGHEVGQGEMRLQALRKQLKRLAAQGEALKAEVAELKRRGRTADLYKKKANDGVRRVSELQKEVAHHKQELHRSKLAAGQAANDMSQLQDNKEFLEAEHVSVLAANHDLQASVETLREQVRLLRSQTQRSVVLAHLPALRPEAQTNQDSAAGLHKCAALEVARRLQLQPAHTPKVAALMERVTEEVLLLSGDRQTLQQREGILMDLLTGHSC